MSNFRDFHFRLTVSECKPSRKCYPDWAWRTACEALWVLLAFGRCAWRTAWEALWVLLAFSLSFFFLRKILVYHWAWGTAWEALWVLLASKTAGVVFFSPWGGLIVKKNNLFIDILAIYVGRGGA
jgi:hypothetical protein